MLKTKPNDRLLDYWYGNAKGMGSNLTEAPQFTKLLNKDDEIFHFTGSTVHTISLIYNKWR